MTSLLLDHIYEGMNVIDIEGHPVGKVELVRYGEGEALPDFPIVLDLLKDSLYDTREFPVETYIRFYKEGFVRINRGVLPPFYIYPAQIGHIIDEDTIVLSDMKEVLLEG
jgi:hypothetical protein